MINIAYCIKNNEQNMRYYLKIWECKDNICYIHSTWQLYMSLKTSKTECKNSVYENTSKQMKNI